MWPLSWLRDRFHWGSTFPGPPFPPSLDSSTRDSVGGGKIHHPSWTQMIRAETGDWCRRFSILHIMLGRGARSRESKGGTPVAKGCPSILVASPTHPGKKSGHRICAHVYIMSAGAGLSPPLGGVFVELKSALEGLHADQPPTTGYKVLASGRTRSGSVQPPFPGGSPFQFRPAPTGDESLLLYL